MKVQVTATDEKNNTVIQNGAREKDSKEATSINTNSAPRQD
jgi:hypothetical protein